MKRHPFDPTSFIFGVVLTAAGIGFLLADQLAWDVDGRWVLPVALIVLGVAGVAGAVAGLRPAVEPAPQTGPTEPEPAADPVAGEDQNGVSSR